MSVVYDQETAGLDPYFGQILQLGTTICDENFNITEEFDLRSRRLPWVIPSPSAMLITKVTPDMIETGTPYFEMMREFNDIVRAQGTPVDTITYNGINFDDPGLRLAFDQNLLQTKFTNHLNEDGTRNRRIDVLIAVQALQIHKPDAITLEQKTAKGATIMKLGVVCRQNGIDLSEDAAHEALADNHGTIGVAKLIQERTPALWDHMVDLSAQEGVRSTLENNDVLNYSRFFFGRPKSNAIAYIGANPEYDAEEIAFDLTQDIEKVMAMDVQELVTTMKERKNNPFVFIRSNKMPILLPMDMVEVAQRPDNISALEEKAARIRSNPEFIDRVQQAAHLKKVEYTLSRYIEKQVYHPIPEDIGEELMGWRKDFYYGDWNQRADLVADFPARFDDELEREPAIIRYQKFGQRIMFDNARGLLDIEQASYLQAAIANRVLSSDGPKDMDTIPRSLAELQEIREKFEAGEIDYLAADEGSRIDDLEKYYRDLGEYYESLKVNHPAIVYETI